MSKLVKRYTKEEKLEIVKLSLEDDLSNQEIGERFNIHPNTLSRWRREYLRNQERSFPGKGIKRMSPHEQEVAELKKELKEAQLERDILKKAISIFSKRDGKFTNL